MTISKTVKILLSIIVILAIALICCILYGVNRSNIIRRIDTTSVYAIQGAACDAYDSIDRIQEQTLALEERQEALLQLSWNLKTIDSYTFLISIYEDAGSLVLSDRKFNNISRWLLGSKSEAGYPIHDSLFADGVIDEQEATILDLLYTDMKEISDAMIITDISDSSPPVTQSRVIRSKELIP